MKRFIATFALSLASLFAQTSIYIGGGPSLHSAGLHGGMNLTVGVCPAASDCILSNYSARFDFASPLAVAYTTGLAEQHILARASTPRGIGVDLFSLASVGASKTAASVGFSGAAGGGLTFHPAKYPNWGTSVAIQADYSPVNPGWTPNIYFQIGYLFHTK